MSATQRLLPIFVAVAVGTVSGAYIFGPPIREYVAESRGTLDPAIARASEAGGVGGGQVKQPAKTIAEEGRERLMEIKDEAKAKLDAIKKKAEQTA